MKKQLIVALVALTTLSSIAMAGAPSACDGLKHFTGLDYGKVEQLNVPPICMNMNAGYTATVGGPKSHDQNKGVKFEMAAASGLCYARIVFQMGTCDSSDGDIDGTVVLNGDTTHPYHLTESRFTTTGRDEGGAYHGKIYVHTWRNTNGEATSPSFVLDY